LCREREEQISPVASRWNSASDPQRG
jgi:hypothetical protein